MVGGLVDEEAEVVVGGLVCVLVVEDVDWLNFTVQFGDESSGAVGGDAGVDFEAGQKVGLDVGEVKEVADFAEEGVAGGAGDAGGGSGGVGFGAAEILNAAVEGEGKFRFGEGKLYFGSLMVVAALGVVAPEEVGVGDIVG